jgi:hypothetical protein
MADARGYIYEIVLYGDALCTIEIGRARTSLAFNGFIGPEVGGVTIPISTIPIPKEYPIYAKLACSDDLYSLDISIQYKRV